MSVLVSKGGGMLIRQKKEGADGDAVKGGRHNRASFAAKKNVRKEQLADFWWESVSGEGETD